MPRRSWMNISSSDVNINLATENASIIANPSGVFDGSLRMLITYNDVNTQYRAGEGLMEINYALTSNGENFSGDNSSIFSYNFNHPLYTKLLPPNQEGFLPEDKFTFAETGNTKIIFSTMKKAAEGSGYILRFFNPADKPVSDTITFAENIATAYETTPVEENVNSVSVIGNSVPLNFEPFEVKTLKVVPSGFSGVENISVPAEFSLKQNYPNPFNPVTTIGFSLPKEGKVSLKVYDILGKEVSTIFSGTKQAGKFSYHFDASSIASGIYFYRLTYTNDKNSFSKIRKMIFLK